jgi:phosphohistidine phosphatase
MKLLVIRHAIAEDRDVWAQSGQDEALRPLTKEGIRKMRKNARGLSNLVSSVDLMFVSPLLRAQQTAEIVLRDVSAAETRTANELTPDASPDQFGNLLLGHAAMDTVAAVGHNPQLERLIGWLIGAHRENAVELRKGAVCLLRLDSEPASGQATVLWSLTPGQLRGLA